MMFTCLRGWQVTLTPSHLSIARGPVQATAILMLGAWLAGIHAKGDEETQDPGIYGEPWRPLL
jgi:hypothetical protein